MATYQNLDGVERDADMPEYCQESCRTAFYDVAALRVGEENTS